MSDDELQAGALRLEAGNDLSWWQGQDFQDIEPAFSGRGDDGPEVCEDLRTFEGSESSRDLHAHLHHAQVLFGLIVGEGDCEVRKEPQDVIAAVTQANDQVMTWPSGFSTSGAGFLDQWWLTFVEGEALGEDRHAFGENILANRSRQFGLRRAPEPWP